MSDLRDLYQDVIFDHYKKPRNYHALPCANHVAHGHNRLCGDQITVYLQLDGDVFGRIGAQTAKQIVLQRIRELMAVQSEQVRREVELSNVPVVVAQADRFRARLGFWDDRRRELEAL